MEDVLFNGKALDSSLKAGQEQMEKDMKDTDFTSLESSYQFIDEAK